MFTFEYNSQNNTHENNQLIKQDKQSGYFKYTCIYNSPGNVNGNYL